MKARVPTGVPVLVELGKKPPLTTDYQAKTPYKILIVITNGKTKRKFLHITRRKSGVYIAHGYPGGFHESYHSDGTRHIKGEGKNQLKQKYEKFTWSLKKRSPLDTLHGFVRMRNATASISNRALRGYARFRDSDGPFNKIVYLDTRTLPESINYEVVLVQPFLHSKIPLILTWPCYFQLFTHCLPWIALIIYEQWPQVKN